MSAMPTDSDRLRFASWLRTEFQDHETRRLWQLEHHGKVDPVTAKDDLRMWQIMVMGRGKRMPTSAEFANRWGWPKTTAYRLVSDHTKWSDPRYLAEWAARWNGRGTDVERHRNGRGTLEVVSTATMSDEWNGSGTEADHTRNESGHTRSVVFSPTVDVDEIDPPLCAAASGPARQAPQPADTPVASLFPAVAADESPKPRKRKPRAAVDKPAVPNRVRVLTDAWAAVWRSRMPGTYGWVWEKDKATIGTIADAFEWDADAVMAAADMTRLQDAMHCYISAALAGTAFPANEPPQVRFFVTGFAKYLAEADREAEQRAIDRADAEAEAERVPRGRGQSAAHLARGVLNG